MHHGPEYGADTRELTERECIEIDAAKACDAVASVQHTILEKLLKTHSGDCECHLCQALGLLDDVSWHCREAPAAIQLATERDAAMRRAPE
jgi:hypothetical protein